MASILIIRSQCLRSLLVHNPFNKNLISNQINSKQPLCFISKNQSLINLNQSCQSSHRLIQIKSNVYQRNISSLVQKRFKTPSVFLLGFGAMTFFVILEFFYDRYRRSGQTLFEFLFQSSSKSKIAAIEDTDSQYFRTKYASILKASDIPDIKPTRIVPGPITLPDIKFTLYQYQNCPFCCKVRTFLEYYGLPYEIVEVNPVMRQQIKFSSLYRKVPILIVRRKNSNNPDDPILQINDSNLIVSMLNSYILSKDPNSKHHGESLTNMARWYLNSTVLMNKNEDSTEDGTFKASKQEDVIINKYFLMIGDISEEKVEKMDSLLARDRRWRRWVDDHLVHVLSPNIYRTMDEALNSFRFFNQVSEWEKNFSKFETWTIINLGATVMYFVSKRLKKKYGLKDDVRQSLYDSCNYWLKSIDSKQKFMGGDTPCLADLTVYAVLSSIEGCKAFDDLQQNTKINDWYFSLKSMIQQNYGSKEIQRFLQP